MRKVPFSEIVITISANYLTAALPHNYEDLSEKEIHDFVEEHMWEPLEDEEPSVILDCILVAARDISSLLERHYIEVTYKE